MKAFLFLILCPLLAFAGVQERMSLAQFKDAVKKCKDFETRDEKGMTLLIKALDRNREDIAQLLIDNGADVGMPDTDNSTPLMYAAANGLEGMVEVLAKKRANINALNNEGESALMWAAYDGKLKVVKLLISLGADPKVRSMKGKTALDFAKENKHTYTANYLSALK